MAKKRIEINKDNKDVLVRLKNVRLSFPHLFEPYAYEEGDEKRFSASFLIQKDDENENIDLMEQAIEAMKKMNGVKKLSADRICFRDGEDKEDTDGYGDEIMYVSCGSKRKVPVVDRDLSVLDEEDGKPYGGCYVNASVRLWFQDHKKGGKRINAQMRAVQFIGDGEAFGDGGADVEEEFEDEDSDGGSGDSCL